LLSAIELQYRDLPARLEVSEHRLEFFFDREAEARILRFPAASPLWLPDHPSRVHVSYRGPDGKMVSAGEVMAQKIIRLPKMSTTTHLSIEAVDGTFGMWSASANLLRKPRWSFSRILD
jgi:hypothetical protein